MVNSYTPRQNKIALYARTKSILFFIFFRWGTMSLVQVRGKKDSPVVKRGGRTKYPLRPLPWSRPTQKKRRNVLLFFVVNFMPWGRSIGFVPFFLSAQG